MADNPAAGEFQTPFPNLHVIVTSGFGWRSFDNAFHAGIDLVAFHEAPVSAIAGGVIVTAVFEPGYGNYITIRHGNGMYSRYAHLEQMFVGVGHVVVQGQVIGSQGNTGRSSGSHLHLEIRSGNTYKEIGALDPRGFIEF